MGVKTVDEKETIISMEKLQMLETEEVELNPPFLKTNEVIRTIELTNKFFKEMVSKDKNFTLSDVEYSKVVSAIQFVVKEQEKETIWNSVQQQQKELMNF